MDPTPGQVLHISFSEFREYNKLEIHDTAALARQAAVEELEDRLPQRPEQHTPVVWYGQAVRCSGVCRTVVETSTSDDILLQPELVDLDAPTAATTQETVKYLQEALQASRAAEARWVKRIKTLERRLGIILDTAEGKNDAEQTDSDDRR